MADHATSADPAVQAQLDRLWALSPGADVLGLERVAQLLARLGNPERRLPPVFHVAGTNGKGSTCAFLRAALEAAGHRVHVYSSPHLVRFNERIRVAGHLIEDAALAPLLAEVLDNAEGIGASFFEVTTAAAFLQFARTPADASVIEVGLGGRLDATNVVTPVVCGIAALGIDHQAFLGNTLAAIAAEKTGIAKPGVPLVTTGYDPAIATTVGEIAARAGAHVLARGEEWRCAFTGAIGGMPMRRLLDYNDRYGSLALRAPAMHGRYQVDNYALAVAMLRTQQTVPVSPEALVRAAETAYWPARMQRLRDDGPLVRRLPKERRHFGVWLDGAHNPQAAAGIADQWTNGTATALVVGLLANKDADGVIDALTSTSGSCEVIAVPVPGHAHHEPEALAALALHHGAARATTAPTIEAAFDHLAVQGSGDSVMIAGSLYLAGEILVANDELPT